MKETVMYKCQKCGDLFDSEVAAKHHEEGHVKAVKVKGEYYLVGYQHLRIPDRVEITFVDQFGYENTADYELTYSGPLSFFQKIGRAFVGLFRKKIFIGVKRLMSNKAFGQPIYEIVMVGSDQVNKDDEGYYIKQTRRVGFFHSKNEALLAVKENRYDIRECSTYNCAFIITRYPGLYDAGMQRMFFKWNENADSFVETKEPASLKSFQF